MYFRNGWLIVCLLLCTTVSAQNINKQSTAQILKTGTSLLELQQYEAAETYFAKALQNAKLQQSVSYQAQAYEGLAHLYAKTGRSSLAVDHYAKAIRLYRAEGQTVVANVLEALMKAARGQGELYAGIEIGARGNKLSIIEVKFSNINENEYSLKMDTSINSDAAALSYQSESDTHDAVGTFYNIVKNRFNISASHTFIVISSGLKQELDKYRKAEYFAKAIRPANMDASIKISYVTAQEESELSFRGIVPLKSKLVSNQLDVGGGNTKGGYFSDKSFIPVTFPLGTKSFERLVDGRTRGGLEAFKDVAEKLMADSLRAVMKQELGNKTEFKSRNEMYVSGGIVWAVVSMMYPKLINENYVELTHDDISNFRKMIYSDFTRLTKPDLAYSVSPEIANASIKNINRVLKTYDQRALMAGAIWLDELMTQVNSVNPNKRLIFPRNSYVGWISGYIMDRINKQFANGVARN